jgi:hypothetical protein
MYSLISQPPPPAPPPRHTVGVYGPTVPGSYTPEHDASTPEALIPSKYTREPLLESNCIFKITPSGKHALVLEHQARPADLQQYQWLLNTCELQTWYKEPSHAYLKARERSGCEAADLTPISDPSPVSLYTVSVWATRALTTPTNDEVYQCASEHNVDGGYVGTCQQCSKDKSEVPDETALAYWLVFTTFQAKIPFIHGAHFNGRAIYKLSRCGSRKAAIAEAFYAAAFSGWSLAFSCVTRLDEEFDECSGMIKEVSELSELSKLKEDKEDVKTVRVFY